MKRKIENELLSIVIISTCFLLFASCKKDKTPEPTPTPTPNPTITDIDGNVHHTVTIGTQIWMVENLKVVRYRNGDSISYVTVNTTWNNMTTGAYRNYADNSVNGNIYGHLYNWYAVGDSRNVAPIGWHVASRTEWETLANYYGGMSVAGSKLKEAGFAHWSSPNTGATNESGFTALPGGAFANGFASIGEYGIWWNSTGWSTSGAYNWNMFSNSTSSAWNSWVKFNGCSVRCIKD